MKKDETARGGADDDTFSNDQLATAVIKYFARSENASDAVIRWMVARGR